MKRPVVLIVFSVLLLMTPGLGLAQEDGGEDGGVEDGGAADTLLPDSSAPDLLPLDVSAPDSLLPDSSAPDFSLPDSSQPDATSGCGSVSFIGECQGDTARYCNGEQVVEVDCVSRFGAGATCGLFDCTDDTAGCIGYFCVQGSGEACSADGLPCDAAADQGCVDAICAASTMCDPSTYTRLCNGTFLTDCTYTVNERDCSEGSTVPRTCGITSSGENLCVGLDGDTCGGASGRECQQGMECVGGVCGGGAVTDAGAGRDGPVGDGDDGDDDESCASVGDSAPAPVALLLGAALLLAWCRRRGANVA